VLYSFQSEFELIRNFFHKFLEKANTESNKQYSYKIVGIGGRSG